MADTYLVFNQAESIHYGDIVKGDLRMFVVVPSEPTSGDARKFGFYSANKDSGMYFEVTGTTFRAVVRDGKTGSSDTENITFETEWAGTPQEYRILWEAGFAKFYVGETLKATIAFSDEDLDVSSAPLNLYVNNENNDDMLVGYIEAVGIQTYT